MTYYDEISQGYDELYEEEQKKKIELIKRKVNIAETDKLLDVGCGTGISTTGFGCEAVGIDPSRELIEIAKKKNPKAKYLVGRAEKLPFGDKNFDIVVSITSLQNFDNVEDALGEIKRVGKNKFVLSFLKKSEKSGRILGMIKEVFNVVEIIQEEKDVIVVAKS